MGAWLLIQGVIVNEKVYMMKGGPIWETMLCLSQLGPTYDQMSCLHTTSSCHLAQMHMSPSQGHSSQFHRQYESQLFHLMGLAFQVLLFT